MARQKPIIDFNTLTNEQKEKLRESTTNVYQLESLCGEMLSFREYHILKMALQGLFGDY